MGDKECKTCEHMQEEGKDKFGHVWPFWCRKYERPVMPFVGQCYVDMKRKEENDVNSD